MRELTALHMGAVALLAEGLTSKEAAFRLGISYPCFFRRIEMAKKRLGCATKEQLMFKVGQAHELEEEA